jgi:dUTP pyrophosphatase
MVKLGIKKLREDAFIPEYKTDGSSGMDLTCPDEVMLARGNVTVINLGFALDIPEGYEVQIRPRSGFSVKYPYLRIANSPGTIDSDYTGEIGIIIHFDYTEQHEMPVALERGDRIAQMVVCPVVKADIDIIDELKKTERGDGGYGSTGFKS